MSSSSLFASLGAALHSFSSPLFFLKVSIPTAKTNPALSAFESDLASQLDRLQSAFCDDITGSSYLSMPWLCRAMQLVLSTHASAEAFVPDLQQALSHGDTKWLDEYLDDSVKLLDICNALREAIEEIKSYHGHVELALHALEEAYMGEAQLRRARNALRKCTDALRRKHEESSHLGQRRSKLEKCSSMLRRMGGKLSMEDASKGNFFMVSYAAQVATIFICGVLTTTLSLKAPGRPLSTISVDGQSTWASSLISLQQRLKEQMERKKAKGANALLEELYETDIAVRSLQDRVEKLLNAKAFPLRADRILDLRQSAGSLRDCSIELSHGLAPLQLHVEGVFKALITSRMALLDIYSQVHPSCMIKL